MRLTLFAATGGTGGHVLDRAVAAGHDVTAVVRDPGALRASVRTVVADLNDPDPAVLEAAVAGADAVLSGLGPRKAAEYGIVSRGTRAIVTAMRAARVRRLVVVSVAGVLALPTPARPHPPGDPGVGVFVRTVLSPLARLRLGRHYADVARMEDDLRASGPDWTSVQLPVLTNRPPTGHYRTSCEQSVPRGYRIARADAAHFVLACLGMPETVGHSIAVAY
ncbi:MULTISPECIES: NAD(P)-dependent oxidoreductase [unclassified Amycolatopsis]|uniref:NAD(P)-dependent oxidoreductase n=1 Tax=unclassified Amycolatopsis TaxID=2618356 RepID=UPI001C69BA0A|nr:NAD(P)H-binding protein [Amycolatopsis sp. DSM 110486]QYN17725.1 NAD(P)H-binding protein [Amycolatopsis sp. DSM 110486]